MSTESRPLSPERGTAPPGDDEFATVPPDDGAPGGAEPAPRALALQARLAVAAVAVLAALVLFWPRGDGTFVAPGGFLTDGAGRPQLIGQRMMPVTLVHFWATWCPPCITEIPALGRLTEDFADHPDFQILMIAVGDDPDKVDTFLGDRSRGVLFDPAWEVAHRYGTRKLPESYLVVRGQVVEKWEGQVDWDDPEVRETLEHALVEVTGARTSA